MKGGGVDNPPDQGNRGMDHFDVPFVSWWTGYRTPQKAFLVFLFGWVLVFRFSLVRCECRPYTGRLPLGSEHRFRMDQTHFAATAMGGNLNKTTAPPARKVPRTSGTSSACREAGIPAYPGEHSSFRAVDLHKQMAWFVLGGGLPGLPSASPSNVEVFNGTSRDQLFRDQLPPNSTKSP